MSFYDILKIHTPVDIKAHMEGTADSDIRRILAKDSIDMYDFASLLSPIAANHLEEMAIKSQMLTKQNFGNTMLLYTPMYIANYCINRCMYCGYNVANKGIERLKLSLEQINKEAKYISDSGLRHVLLLTGESPHDSSVDYIASSVDILKQHFNSIGIEIYPLDTKDYSLLIDRGVTGLTIYQETYDTDVYDRIHISGPKKDYIYRLNAAERGCIAGMREVNIGALLGLSDPIIDAFYTGLHAKYLIDKYPATEVGISIPRIRPHGGETHDVTGVEDRTLVQIILAMRIFKPRLGISLSTRETQELRDNLIPLGITRMSAGVSTSVGGHTSSDKSTEQFEISDNRSLCEVKEMLLNKGYQPVHSDWIHF